MQWQAFQQLHQQVESSTATINKTYTLGSDKINAAATELAKSIQQLESVMQRISSNPPNGGGADKDGYWWWPFNK